MRRVLAVAGLAGLVIVGGLVGDHIDTSLPFDRVIVLPGTAGVPVAIGKGAVTVHDATAGDRLEDPSGDVWDTRGRWVVLGVTLQGERGPIDDVNWWLEDGEGRRFEATDRVRWNVPAAQPGMAVRSAVVFEVAPDVDLTAATIVMTTHGYRQETAIRVAIESDGGVLTIPDPELEEAP